MGLPGLSLSEGTQDPILPNQPCSGPCVRLSIVFFTSHKLLGPLLKELSELKGHYMPYISKNFLVKETGAKAI